MSFEAYLAREVESRRLQGRPEPTQARVNSLLAEFQLRRGLSAELQGLLDVLREPGWEADGAVAALGGWWKGEDLVDLDPALWRRFVESHLTSHFLVARALLPVLGGPDPAYVQLNGAAAQEVMPGSGPVNVTGAGQAMLLDVLRAEAIGARVRLHEVRVLHAVAGDDRNEDPASTADAQEVARLVQDVLREPTTPARVYR